MDEITTLLGMIEDVAPEVWRIAMQQVAVDIRVTGFWLAVFAIGAVVCAYIAFRMFRDPDSDKESEDACFVFLCIAVVLAFITALAATSLYRVVANPEYRAIEILLELMR